MILACGCCRHGSIWLEEKPRTRNASCASSLQPIRRNSTPTICWDESRCPGGSSIRALAEYKALADRSRSPAGTTDANRDDRGGARPSRRRARQLRTCAGGGPQGGRRGQQPRVAIRGRRAARRGAQARHRRAGRNAAAARGRGHARVDYYRKGLATHAVAAFDRALSKAPDNPVYTTISGLPS